MYGIIMHGRRGGRNNFDLLHLVIILFGVVETVKGSKGEEPTLTKCSGFSDHRTHLNKIQDDSTNSLTIPANLSSRGEVLHFKLEPGDLKCNGKIDELDIAFENGLMLSPSKINSTSWARDFQKFEEATKRLPNHFTSDGHFFHGDYFLNPDTDFCVKSISNNLLELRLCPQGCDGTVQGRICFPKCCAIDEAFLWKRCVKLSDITGNDNYWTPELYKKQWHGGYNKMPQNEFQKNVKFYYAHIPPDCNAGPEFDPWANNTDGLDTMGDSNITDEYEDDYDYNQPFLKSYSSVFIKHPHGNDSTSKNHIRLTLDKNGNVVPMLLYTVTRKWVLEKYPHFCADAVIMKGKDEIGGGSIKPDSYRLFYCSPPEKDIFDSHSQAVLKSTIYTVFSVISTPFLVLTVVIYLIILDKLNLHGLTILSYSISELMAFLLLITAHLIFLTFDEEAIKWIGIHERGWPCYLIAVSAHFFFLSSYTWLLVMNFDLWVTFRCLRVARKDSKELMKYLMYSLVAWGVPLLIISCFMIIDKVYREPATEVPVPDYATSACFVSPEFRGYYVHIPVAILISMNIVLILLTMKFFFDARETSARVNASQFSAKLFAKLFIVMGGASLVDFVSWYYTDTQENKPWSIVIIESVSYLVPVLLFYLFCLNDRTLSQLRDKYPQLKVWCSPFKKLFKRGEDETSKSTDATTASVFSKTERIRLKTISNGKELSSSSSN